jgi:hypothetical protein
MQVEHAAHCPVGGSNNVLNANPVWLPLSPAAAQFVRAQEEPYHDPSSSVWRCNHCAHHFDKQTLQADAIDHVKVVYVFFVVRYLASTELGYAVIASDYQRSVWTLLLI